MGRKRCAFRYRRSFPPSLFLLLRLNRMSDFGRWESTSFSFFYEGRSALMRSGFIGRISRWIRPSVANCRSVDFVSNQLEGISNRSLLEGAWSFASLVLWSISGSITSDEGEGGWPKIPSPSKNMVLFLLQLKQTKHRKETSCKGWVPWLLSLWARR